MNHPLLAQLDRRLNRRGQVIDVFRGIVSTPTITVSVPAIVRMLAQEQLVAGLSQQNAMIIISPTHLKDQQWPDAAPVKIGDWVRIRGAVKSIERVAPIFDSGVCIRIDLIVKG
jgi:hypothetical protein